MKRALDVLAAILAWRWLFDLLFETVETAHAKLSAQRPVQVTLEPEPDEGDEGDEGDEEAQRVHPMPPAQRAA